MFFVKPLAPTIDECLEIKKLCKKNNLFVAVGFQWSYSKAIQNLKKDIIEDKFEGYDTVFMRINTDNNCQLLYLATVASTEQKEPAFEIELEKATVYYDLEEADNIILKTEDGRILEYGSPEEGRFTHWLAAVEAIRTKNQLACDMLQYFLK
jgi:hypothetical protein